MNIELKGDNFELSFKYKPSIVDRIRQIPGRRFDGTRKVWIIPTRSRVDLERMIYQIQQFENINWLSGNEKGKKKLFTIFRNFRSWSFLIILKFNLILINLKALLED